MLEMPLVLADPVTAGLEQRILALVRHDSSSPVLPCNPSSAVSEQQGSYLYVPVVGDEYRTRHSLVPAQKQGTVCPAPSGPAKKTDSSMSLNGSA